MATLIVEPRPEDINVVDVGLELLDMKHILEKEEVTWDKRPAFEIVRGFSFGIYQNVTSVRQLIATVNAASIDGLELPKRGTYRFLRAEDHDLRSILRGGIAPEKTRPSDLILLDDSPNERTGRQMEGTSLTHSTTAGGRIFGHCLLNAYHAGAEASGFVDFELKMNKKTKKGYRRRGRLQAGPARALHLPLRALALAIIDREKARGNKAKTVVADTGFFSKGFCRRLRRRGRHWVLAAKVNTRVEYRGELMKLRELFHNVRSTKSFGDARYRVFNVVLPGYGPVRAFFIRFVDRNGNWHTRYLLTDLTKRKASARSVLRKYLRRWTIEIGHRTTKETFNLRGYHGRSFCGHVNFYALVMLAHQIAEAVTHLWEVHESAQESVPTLAFRFRLAVIMRGSASTSAAATKPRSTTGVTAWPRGRINMRKGSYGQLETMMGTTLDFASPVETMPVSTS